MAGLRGNQAYLLAAKQTAKATPATAWQDKYFFSGGNIAPSHGTDQLAETDDTRDAGDFYTTQTGVEGAPEVYTRDASIHHLLEYALGTLGTAGAGPDYVHTITAADELPYVMFGRAIGDTLFEQFDDNKVSELTISAGTASPLTASLSVMGRSATRLAAEWTAGLAPPAAATVAPFNYNEAAVTLSSGATSLVSSFEMTISNNVTLQQTDDSIPYDVVEGTRSVSLGFDLVFENLDEYNLFQYGSRSGTTQQSTIYTTDANFRFSKGAANYLSFDFPTIAYQEFPVEPDPGGDPIVVSVRAASQRDASGFVTARVGNQQAT